MLLLSRVLMVAIGLTLFVLGLDLITNADDIVEGVGNGFSAIVLYATWRMPELLTELLPATVLLAALLTFGRLLDSGELVPLWGFGISPAELFRALAGVGLLVGFVSFVLQDRMIPITAEKLIEWGVGDYGKNRRIDQIEDLWVRSPGVVVRIPVASARKGSIENIVIFERDGLGRLLKRIDARQARSIDGGLDLADVTVRQLPENTVAHHAQLRWEGELPGDLSLAIAHPSELSTLRLARMARTDAQGLWPAHFYKTWLQKRLATIFVPLVLIGISVALSQRLRPRRGTATFFFIGTGCGFAYFLLSGWAIALGELGFLPPVLAAWSPIAILASVAGSFVVFREGPSRQVAKATTP